MHLENLLLKLEGKRIDKIFRQFYRTLNRTEHHRQEISAETLGARIKVLEKVLTN